jgi:predicted TIM-barrel fold metal-dependent hydrolase
MQNQVTNAVLGVVHTRPTTPIPANACDCHVHVIGPIERYPQIPDRAFMPGPASVQDLVAMHRSIGIERVVIVQASPQGTDNRCVIDALNEMKALGRPARGVAVIAPGTTDEQLREMHDAGIRALRVNLYSAGEYDLNVAKNALNEAATRVAPMGWHVQLFTTLPIIASLHDAILQSPVPIVLDHFGMAMADKGIAQAGFPEILSLVRAGKVYVKLSAPHRIAPLPDCPGADVMARALIDANLDCMLWGSDWPHPGAWPGKPRSRDKIEPYHPIDDGVQLQRFASWVSSAELNRILVDNPARLYNF